MNQGINIRFRLEKQDIEASLKLVWRRQLLPWLMYAGSAFLAFVAYKTATVSGYRVAAIPLFVSLIGFALPSLFPYAHSKKTLENLKKAPESELEFSSAGVKQSSGSQSFLPWTSLQLEENSHILNLLNQKRQVLAIIPKRAFKSSEELVTIHRWLIDSLQTK
jgi:hypothetical protein